MYKATNYKKQQIYKNINKNYENKLIFKIYKVDGACNSFFKILSFCDIQY